MPKHFNSGPDINGFSDKFILRGLSNKPSFYKFKVKTGPKIQKKTIPLKNIFLFFLLFLTQIRHEINMSPVP